MKQILIGEKPQTTWLRQIDFEVTKQDKFGISNEAYR